jgi:hypothetical protein
MLLTITTTHQPAHDLGNLLNKHPGRFQSSDLRKVGRSNGRGRGGQGTLRPQGAAAQPGRRVRGGGRIPGRPPRQSRVRTISA